jgi:hypothetical protein
MSCDVCIEAPGAGCSLAAAELLSSLIKWSAWLAVRQQIKKQKNTLPTVAANWQTTLNMG